MTQPSAPNNRASHRSNASPVPHPAAPAFERVCAVADVGRGELFAADLSDGTPVCVANRDGTFLAVRDQCPHQKIRLSDGNLTPDGSIVCSWHGAAYDCATGCALRGPLDGGRRAGPVGRLVVLDVKVEGGAVFVRPPELLISPKAEQ